VHTTSRGGLVAAPVEVVFSATLSLPLPQLYSRRYGPMPPIVAVRNQSGPWDTLGRTRVLLTADGGAMHEELVSLSPPDAFTNRLTVLRGPFRPLVSGLEETWSFRPVGSGTEATWEWTLHPRSAAAGLLAPLVGWLWRGYADGVLAQLRQEVAAGPERAEPPG
jgi:hypothetical protein